MTVEGKWYTGRNPSVGARTNGAVYKDYVTVGGGPPEIIQLATDFPAAQYGDWTPVGVQIEQDIQYLSISFNKLGTGEWQVVIVNLLDESQAVAPGETVRVAFLPPARVKA